MIPQAPRSPGEMIGSGPAAVPDAGAHGRQVTVGTAAGKGKKGRRARLTVKRIDPWSTLKFSFVYGLAGMIVLLVAVVVLYGVVEAMVHMVTGALRAAQALDPTLDTRRAIKSLT